MKRNSKSGNGKKNSDCANSTTSFDTLVAQAKGGDRRALEELLREARPRAMAVAMKVLRNPSDAEDAVQDALLKVWRYLPRFEGRASFFTWIHRIVMNTSLDLRRRGKSRAGLRDDLAEEEGGELEVPTFETPETALVRKQDHALVHSALATLSDVHREALQKRELEEYSYEEIASTARCPVGTVMSRLHHARRRLQSEIASRLAVGGLVRDAA